MTCRRLLHWGPIAALTVIFSLCTLSICTFLAWCPPTTEDTFSQINFFTFYFWVFLILRNFFKASSLGPGHLKYRWKPADEEDVAYLQYCQPCQGYKAPRAHHCKSCKRCIMKMDHHCPWINNCVGHYNHKSFTLFLTFVVIGCTHLSIMMTMCVIDHIMWVEGYMLLRDDEDTYLEMNHILLIFMFFGIGLAIGVTLAVAFLLYYQMKSIARNETGIESWIVEKAMSRPRPEGEVWMFPYDLGLFENISQVLTWSHDYVGDGIHWQVFEDLDEYTLTIEQLEQKEIKMDRMVIFEGKKEYSGSWFPISLSIRTCCSAPWSEEKRISLAVGDILHVTRIRRHWLYGEKQVPPELAPLPILGESSQIKGWFPRCCVEEVVEDGITLLQKPKTE